MQSWFLFWFSDTATTYKITQHVIFYSVSVRNGLSTSDSDGEDGRTVGSDPIAGLAVVLTALSGSDLGDGEDGARLGTPSCRRRRIYSLFRK